MADKVLLNTSLVQGEALRRQSYGASATSAKAGVAPGGAQDDRFILADHPPSVLERLRGYVLSFEGGFRNGVVYAVPAGILLAFLAPEVAGALVGGALILYGIEVADSVRKTVVGKGSTEQVVYLVGSGVGGLVGGAAGFGGVKGFKAKGAPLEEITIALPPKAASEFPRLSDEVPSWHGSSHHTNGGGAESGFPVGGGVTIISAGGLQAVGYKPPVWIVLPRVTPPLPPDSALGSIGFALPKGGLGLNPAPLFPMLPPPMPIPSDDKIKRYDLPGITKEDVTLPVEDTVARNFPGIDGEDVQEPDVPIVPIDLPGFEDVEVDLFPGAENQSLLLLKPRNNWTKFLQNKKIPAEDAEDFRQNIGVTIDTAKEWGEERTGVTEGEREHAAKLGLPELITIEPEDVGKVVDLYTWLQSQGIHVDFMEFLGSIFPAIGRMLDQAREAGGTDIVVRLPKFLEGVDIKDWGYPAIAKATSGGNLAHKVPESTQSSHRRGDVERPKWDTLWDYADSLSKEAHGDEQHRSEIYDFLVLLRLLPIIMKYVEIRDINDDVLSLPTEDNAANNPSLPDKLQYQQRRYTIRVIPEDPNITYIPEASLLAWYGSRWPIEDIRAGLYDDALKFLDEGLTTIKWLFANKFNELTLYLANIKGEGVDVNDLRQKYTNFLEQHGLYKGSILNPKEPLFNNRQLVTELKGFYGRLEDFFHEVMWLTHLRGSLFIGGAVGKSIKFEVVPDVFGAGASDRINVVMDGLPVIIDRFRWSVDKILGVFRTQVLIGHLQQIGVAVDLQTLVETYGLDERSVKDCFDFLMLVGGARLVQPEMPALSHRLFWMARRGAPKTRASPVARSKSAQKAELGIGGITELAVNAYLGQVPSGGLGVQIPWVEYLAKDIASVTGIEYGLTEREAGTVLSGLQEKITLLNEKLLPRPPAQARGVEVPLSGIALELMKEFGIGGDYNLRAAYLALPYEQRLKTPSPLVGEGVKPRWGHAPLRGGGEGKIGDEKLVGLIIYLSQIPILAKELVDDPKIGIDAYLQGNYKDLRLNPQDIKELFLDYIRARIIQPGSININLNELITSRVGDQFGPYVEIVDEAIFAYRKVLSDYLNFLADYFRDQHELILTAIDMAADESHAQDLMAFEEEVAKTYGTIKLRDAVQLHILFSYLTGAEIGERYDEKVIQVYDDVVRPAYKKWTREVEDKQIVIESTILDLERLRNGLQGILPEVDKVVNALPSTEVGSPDFKMVLGKVGGLLVQQDRVREALEKLPPIDSYAERASQGIKLASEVGDEGSKREIERLSRDIADMVGRIKSDLEGAADRADLLAEEVMNAEKASETAYQLFRSRETLRGLVLDIGEAQEAVNQATGSIDVFLSELLSADDPLEFTNAVIYSEWLKPYARNKIGDIEKLLSDPEGALSQAEQMLSAAAKVTAYGDVKKELDEEMTTLGQAVAKARRLKETAQSAVSSLNERLAQIDPAIAQAEGRLPFAPPPDLPTHGEFPEEAKDPFGRRVLFAGGKAGRVSKSEALQLLEKLRVLSIADGTYLINPEDAGGVRKWMDGGRGSDLSIISFTGHKISLQRGIWGVRLGKIKELPSDFWYKPVIVGLTRLGGQRHRELEFVRWLFKKDTQLWQELLGFLIFKKGELKNVDGVRGLIHRFAVANYDRIIKIDDKAETWFDHKEPDPRELYPDIWNDNRGKYDENNHKRNREIYRNMRNHPNNPTIRVNMGNGRVFFITVEEEFAEGIKSGNAGITLNTSDGEIDLTGREFHIFPPVNKQEEVTKRALEWLISIYEDARWLITGKILSIADNFADDAFKQEANKIFARYIEGRGNYPHRPPYGDLVELERELAAAYRKHFLQDSNNIQTEGGAR